MTCPLCGKAKLVWVREMNTSYMGWAGDIYACQSGVGQCEAGGTRVYVPRPGSYASGAAGGGTDVVLVEQPVVAPASAAGAELAAKLAASEAKAAILQAELDAIKQALGLAAAVVTGG